ncbi:MAG: YcxB family protein [Oscillospiraceae bacterium]|nr:YcxB family protein [Oscillospiraceae bacterium]
MGILKEMFGEESGDSFETRPPVLLAIGRYKSSAETVMEGYKTYQKKYVIKNTVLKMLLVLLALASSVMMLISSEDGGMMPVLLIMICLCAGIYFINEPINSRKKLKSGLSAIEGTEYEIEITDRTIKISTVEVPEEEGTEENTVPADEEAVSEGENGEEANAEDQGPPATIIHLDGAVEIIDKEDMFIICVSKKYIFIVPKSAFKEDELQLVREKLAAVMGIRFKMVD